MAKRHIGKLFRIKLDDGECHALCIQHHERYGYLMAFLDRDFSGGDPTIAEVFFYGYMWLDSEIRGKNAAVVEKLPDFEPFFPKMRSGGIMMPEGGLSAWFVVQEPERQRVKADYPGLSDLSDADIHSIDSIRERYRMGWTPRILFEKCYST